MTNINLFTSNLQGRALVSEKSATKKAIIAVLANYEESINAEYGKLIKSKEQSVRNVVNAAKGKFKTALDVVANCYPYQTKDGKLATRGKDENGNKVWKEKKLTAAAARGIVRDALKNFTDTVGNPEVKTVIIGSVIES